MIQIPQQITETLAARSRIPHLELEVSDAAQRRRAAVAAVAVAESRLVDAGRSAVPIEKRQAMTEDAKIRLADAKKELVDAETALRTATEARDGALSAGRYADTGAQEKTALRASSVKIQEGIDAALKRMDAIPNLRDRITACRAQHGRSLAAAAMGDSTSEKTAGDLAAELATLDDQHFEGEQLRNGLTEWIASQRADLQEIEKALRECARSDLRKEQLALRDQSAELQNQIERLQTELATVSRRADVISRKMSALK